MADEPKTAAQLADEARRPAHLVRVHDVALGRSLTMNRDAVIDPDGNVVDGLEVLEGEPTIDTDLGRWLPSEEYTAPAPTPAGRRTATATPTTPEVS